MRRSNIFRPFSRGFLGGSRRAQEGPGSPYKLPAPGNALVFGWRFQVLAVQLRLLRTMTDASESKRGQRAAECHDKAADMDSQVRVATLAALRRGEVVAPHAVAELLRNVDKEVRSDAIKALANLGVAVGLLCDKDAAVRRCACEALPKLGEAASCLAMRVLRYKFGEAQRWPSCCATRMSMCARQPSGHWRISEWQQHPTPWPWPNCSAIRTRLSAAAPVGRWRSLERQQRRMPQPWPKVSESPSRRERTCPPLRRRCTGKTQTGSSTAHRGNERAVT